MLQNLDQKQLLFVKKEVILNAKWQMLCILAGFDVKDVHMTDLISGRETLEDIQFIGAVGGFSNSDVLGSAKGWAGAFLYNEKANTALKNFFKREDTLSVGICNGCQLFMELELINPEHEVHGKMHHNDTSQTRKYFYFCKSSRK
jgi:phosphoribosylformylglycinamidine synthase